MLCCDVCLFVILLGCFCCCFLFCFVALCLLLYVCLCFVVVVVGLDEALGSLSLICQLTSEDIKHHLTTTTSQYPSSVPSNWTPENNPGTLKGNPNQYVSCQTSLVSVLNSELYRLGIRVTLSPTLTHTGHKHAILWSQEPSLRSPQQTNKQTTTRTKTGYNRLSSILVVKCCLMSSDVS